MTKLIILAFILPILLISCTASQNSLTKIDSSALPPDHPPVATTPNNGDTVASLQASGSALLGSRYFVASVLLDIFLNSTTMSTNEINQLKDIINSNIMNAPNEFGGAPNVYSTAGLYDVPSTTCNSFCSNEDMISLPMNSNSNPARAAVLTKTCKSIIDRDLYTKEALRKAGILTTSDAAMVYDSTKVQNVYELFYMGETAPKILIDTITAGTKTIKASGLKNIDQWKFILQSFCESAHWQRL